MIKLCVFLGNQGQEYRFHRHNVVGFSRFDDHSLGTMLECKVQRAVFSNEIGFNYNIFLETAYFYESIGRERW